MFTGGRGGEAREAKGKVGEGRAPEMETDPFCSEKG